MESDFSALASRLAARGDVLGCIIVSVDGMILGEFPPGNGSIVKPAWLQLASLGEPSRGFLSFPGEIWAFVRGARYGVFAVGTPSVRPGVVLEELDQVLSMAEEWHARREALRDPESVDVSQEETSRLRRLVSHRAAKSVKKDESAAKAPPMPEPRRASLDGEEVDPVVLSQEFAGLLQDESLDDEEHQ
jgi:hypothetical protein